MEYSCVQLYDLPDEILIIILKKIGYYGNGFVYPLPNSMLDRLCLHILPEIHQKIQWFDLESRSMKRILLTTPYPNLYGISLYNIQTETAIGLFTDETSAICTLKSQISTLVIDISTNEIQKFPANDNAIIFTHIFILFTNLQYFNFLSIFIGSSTIII
ncbi:unnamed protein product [Rotaria magnacalcarata]|uniref:Uncharacterized protein n=2 Tax=Rotaria magnacalcarata TaxID=392030 RepID=A0A814MZ56_9BILA|nr:unnamed protein product [Rotaria magnacalcarata]